MAPEITYELMLTPQAIEKPWQFFTHILVHANIQHLLYNIFALALFGSILESVIGHRKFALLVLATIVVTGIVSYAFYDYVLGISGVVYAILGCLAILRPRIIVWVFGAPMPIIVAIIFWILLDIVGAFYPSKVAHFSHLAGIFFGIICGVMWRKEYGENKSKENDENVDDIAISEEEIRRWEEKWLLNFL
jgi:membrane associated rhomboid family serine protease